MMSWEDVTGANPNLTRFLDFLAKAEGADWDTVVGGGKFSDFSRHPNIVGLRTAEGPSTAAGRYQITGTTYRDVAPKIGVNDFSKESQNQVAIELIRRNGALDDVLSGNFEPAIQKLGGVWASLPSSPYKQPKRDWNFVKANLTNAPGDDGWETIAPAQGSAKDDGGWETVTPAAPSAAPAPATQATPAAPKAPVAAPKKEERGVFRRVDDFVRGVADTLTFGYADEFAAKMDSLIGGGQSGKKAYDEAVAAQRQRDKEGGTERVVGQVAGALVPTGMGVVKGLQAAPNASRLVRGAYGIASGAATGAVQGGLYGSGSAEGDLASRAEGAVEGAKTGAVLGGALGGAAGVVLPATKAQKGNSFVKKAGGEDAARLDGEIVVDLKKLAENETKRGNPLTTIDANAIETKYINDVNAALKRLGKTQDVSAVRDAIMNRRALTPEDLNAIRGSAAGDAAADAIEKAQRLRSMTQAMQSSGGVLPLMREGVDQLPIPQWANRGLKALLGGRQTRETAIQNAIKQADGAENVLERFGPSRATESMGALNAAVERAQKAQAAKKAADEAARLAQAQQNAATKLQVLKDTRRPLSGAFQELLPGGASNLNLSSKEAIDALRLVSRQQKEGPVGEAAMQILRSGNVPNKDAFYGLQNQLRKMQEGGVIAGRPGALTEATSSGVRNPISYAETVRTAGAAADLARANAPSKELAQFATRVAGIKSPEAKAKAVADRLSKTSDPAEQAFLTQFVEPLAQFGKKAK